jgi:3-oxoacyl-[acyl-carrier-protein] synthase III
MSTTNRAVYITATGAYFPNEPVDNDHLEQVLGVVGGKPSRLRDRVLKQNGIHHRHYALNADGVSTHMNEELAAHAGKAALQQRGMRADELDMLACGTTMGDAAVPGFASMVHGRLGGGPLEILSAAGVCCAGMQAFAGAHRAVAAGHKRNALVIGSELVSRFLKASRFERSSDDEEREEALGYRAFDAEFLRFMLSDGAGAWLLESKPAATGLSLRVDWVEVTSYAHERPVCMYAGLAHKDAPKAGDSWLDWPTIADADKAGVTRLRQDTRLLPDIVKLGVEEYVRLIRRERIRPEQLDHVLCHYSSMFFKGEVFKLLQQAGVAVPEERWFTNLPSRGNTGSASIFVMLEEALRVGRFQKGERIVLMVPESPLPISPLSMAARSVTMSRSMTTRSASRAAPRRCWRHAHPKRAATAMSMKRWRHRRWVHWWVMKSH